MSNTSNPTAVAQALYQATVKELSTAHDPNLQREVFKSLDQMIRGSDQNAVEISSAIALTTAEKTAIEQKLTAKFKRPLTFEYKVDAALLGGVVARVGDKVIDGSLSSRLTAMRETLMGGLR